MNRKLIFITNDGGTENYLPGVGIDKRHYLQFFSSDEGGAWDDDEVMLLDCDKKNLYIYLLALTAHNQYLLIVFLGHGYARNDNETMFELQKGDEVSLSEIRLWTHSTRCLFIADSCRVKVPLMEDGGRVPEIRMFTESNNAVHRDACKRAYNARVIQVAKGSFFAGLATSLGESAKENDHIGGYYSHALLESAKEFIDDNATKGIASFSYIHTQARAKVQQQTNYEQNPEYIGTRGFITPFVVKV